MTNEKMPLAVAPFRGEPMVYISDALAAIEAATLKATEAEREPCKNKSMGKHACTNRTQCWEPCGELGHSAEHARPSMRNFCGRCGKRLGSIDSIHTCTPPTGTGGNV